MIADHIMVRLKPGISEQEFELLNKKHGATIRKKIPMQELYLVAFANADVDTVLGGIARRLFSIRLGTGKS